MPYSTRYVLAPTRGRGKWDLRGVVTDHATFGYLQDVIVDPEWRGRGIGRSLLKCVMDDPIVSSLRTLLLRTEDAHGLYRKAGFALAPNPQDLMAKYRGDL